MTYVTNAVEQFVSGLKERGLLAARPVRIDGLVEAELDSVLPSLEAIVAPGRVAILAQLTAEHRGRIDSDRATRYRNEIDAHGGGFVLLLPHGQVPESSLNEPAFLVVTRDSLFRDALARRRTDLDLSPGDVEGIRQSSRYRQAESIFAFLSSWDDLTGVVEANAPYEHLGLLADSGLGGSPEAVVERLRRDSQATDLIARPGLSPTRLVDELAAKVELDSGIYRDEVTALARWWQAGRIGPPPPALDFATWPTRTGDVVEIDFERDLRRPPHRGWKDQGGDAVVDADSPTATFEWVPDQVPADARYVVQLVEATSGQDVIKAVGGKSARTRRSLRWSNLLKGEALLEELKALDPAGEESGYSFILRLLVTRGKAELKSYTSLPFIARVRDAPDDVGKTASPTLYHALYQFHTEQRAEAPWIASVSGENGLARFESANGRTRDTAIDVSPALLEIERRMVGASQATGPFVARPSKPGEGAALEWSGSGSIHGSGLPDDLVSARTRLFEKLVDQAPVESLPWAEEPWRTLAIDYVDAFHAAVGRIDDYARKAGVPAAEDQLRTALMLSLDTVKVMVRDDQDEIPILLVPPLHPASLAWLVGFGDLVWEWTREAFEPDRKPSYHGVIEQMGVGPRTMALATFERGMDAPAWWGYGGNLTGAWQAFVPIAGPGDVRARDWTGLLLEALALPPRPVGVGLQDARRVGSRLKKYAVLHPYVNQLALAVLTSGEGRDLLEALRVIDERPGTPAGAASVKDLRYEVTLLGPRSPRLGRSIDAMVADPGDARWSRYSTAILDNSETVLAPGFAHARRSIEPSATGEPSSLWDRVRARLEEFAVRGVHATIIGPMLTADIGLARKSPSALTRRGLAARPTTTVLTPENQQSPYQGDWVLTIGAGPSPEGIVARTVADVARALVLARGSVSEDYEVGLAVKLAGPMAKVLRKAHQVSDWVIIADPLFSIELMDRRRREGHETVMLDYTPEFDPYPGGRVVVTTNWVTDLGEVGGKALDDGGVLATVLSSISARRLLELANPTRQVVGGLRGLALTRAFIARRLPGALAVPVDGHEDMFVSKKAQKTGTLADLVAVTLKDGALGFHVFESKYSASGAIGAMMEAGRGQARATGDVLRDEYFDYPGVDREFRIEALRDIVLFHHARALRHGVRVAFKANDVRAAFANEAVVRAASVTYAVVGWTPMGVANAGSTVGADDVEQWLMGAEDIDQHERLVRAWPESGSTVRSTTESGVGTTGDQGGSGDSQSGAGAGPPDFPENIHGAPSAAGQAADRSAGQPVAPPSPPQGPHVTSGTKAESGETSRPEQAVAAAARPAAQPPVGPTPSGPSAPPALQKADPDCLRLGSVAGSGKPALWCPPLLSNGHLILVGGSGAGKTTALRHITSQLRAAGLPVLILDFHGDIKPVESKEHLYRFEYAANSVFVNPFHLDPKYNLIPLRLRDQFIEAWKRRYYSMGIQQYNYLVDLIDDAFAAKGITSDPSTWTQEVDFGDVIRAFDRSEASDTVKEKIRAYMRAFSEWKIFHGGTSIAIESFLDESVRLDLSQLDENARSILADVVLRRLFLLCNAIGPLQDQAGWAKFRAYVVIDEAQILMGSQGDAKASLSRYAAEARKFGIGLILATQLKDNVPEEIWGNVDTRLFMQALDPTERARNAKAAGLPEDTLRSLARGEAILTSSSQAMQRPVRIKIEPPWLM